jgi:hypothetical protein
MVSWSAEKRPQVAHKLGKSKWLFGVARDLRSLSKLIMKWMNMSTLPCAIRAVMEKSGCGWKLKFHWKIVAIAIESVLYDQTSCPWEQMQIPPSYWKLLKEDSWAWNSYDYDKRSPSKEMMARNRERRVRCSGKNWWCLQGNITPTDCKQICHLY